MKNCHCCVHHRLRGTECEHCVLTAEGKRMGQRCPWRCATAQVGDVIQVAHRVWGSVMRRGGIHPSLKAFAAQMALQTPAAEIVWPIWPLFDEIAVRAA